MNILNNQEEAKIEVLAEVCLYNNHYMEKNGKITAVFNANVYDLSNQIDSLIKKVEVRSRAIMLQKYAETLIELSESKHFPRYKEKPRIVFISVSFNSKIIHTFCGNEITFTKGDINVSSMFEWKTLEHAKEQFAIQALKSFAELGGH